MSPTDFPQQQLSCNRRDLFTNFKGVNFTSLVRLKQVFLPVTICFLDTAF